tara:strand:+ start:1763 stop:2299 length:537 start_codon:yes stop_codon:yes gene_type:complete
MRRLLFLLLFSTAVFAEEEVIKTEAVTDSTIRTEGTNTTVLKSPPPSAVIPSMNISNSDLCTVGVAGTVQTQILGLSAGRTVRDMNCEKLKNAKTLYDMGMKVAAVSVMCQDKRVFDAMMHAGTPCPYNGEIGDLAKAGWASHIEVQPKPEKRKEWSDDTKTIVAGSSVGALLLLLLL